MKTCSTCKVSKPFEDFYADRKMKDGHQAKCKDCIKSEYMRNKFNDLNRVVPGKRRAKRIKV